MATSVRRGHGEGSIYWDEANGTWVGAISLGWRADGKRIRRKVTGRTKTEVREKLKQVKAEAEAGLKTSASYTLSKAVDDWSAEALGGLADKTVRSHVDLLRPVISCQVQSSAAIVVSCDLLKDSRLLPPDIELGHVRAGEGALVSGVHQVHQRLRVGVGEGLQKNGVYHREYGSIRTDSDGNDKNGDDRESGSFQQ